MEDFENWYEKIVSEKISRIKSEQVARPGTIVYDDAMWSDVACLALNHLPPRYVRHSVDMQFYLSPQENAEMDQRVEQAIANAMNYVRQHPNPGRGSDSNSATIN